MKLKSLVWFLVALLALVYAGSPWVAVHEMRAAARAQDAAKLGSYVDFAALRESLKNGVHARLLGKERNENGDPSPANAMGAAVAGALLGPMVDALITPQSLTRVLQGQSPAKAVVAGAVGQSGKDSRDDPALETHMGYEGLNSFVFSVRKQDTDDEPVELVFHRDGLFGWKLADLRLP